MMPVMDGWDFRQHQLQDPELRDIPVVVITAAGFSAQSITAQFGGNIEHLSKPLEIDALSSTLARLCR